MPMHPTQRRGTLLLLWPEGRRVCSHVSHVLLRRSDAPGYHPLALWQSQQVQQQHVPGCELLAAGKQHGGSFELL